YRPSLGENGKHPAILGQPAKLAWPEIWDLIKPLIDQVLGGGEATWSEDQLIPIYRNGKIEDVYWTFSYSPVNDESGKPAGVLVTCSETTEKVRILQEIKEREERLHFTINAAELGTWDLNPATNRFVGNNRLKTWFGLDPEEEIDLPLALDNILEQDRQRVIDAMQAALQPGTDGNYEIEYGIKSPIDQVERRVLAKGKAVFNENQEPYRFSGTLQDITDQLVAWGKVQESEKRFRNLVLQSPVPMAIFRGGDQVIEMANVVMLEKIWRRKESEVIGKKLLQVFPELVEQKYPELLRQVFTTGQLHRENESIAYIQGDDGLKKFYLDFDLTPLLETDQSVSGLMVTMSDVTEKVEARKKVEEAEERLRLAAEAAEMSTWDLDLQTREIIHSPRLAEIFGHHRSKKLSHPAMRSQVHPDDLHDIVEKAFDTALQTGIYKYLARMIKPNGEISWIRTQGKVFYDEANQPLKMIGTLRDVTEEKFHQQTLQESEQKFRLLADSMPQHIWTSDPQGNLNYYNQSVFDYSGLSAAQIAREGWLQIVHPDDRPANIIAWTNAISTGQDFLLEHRFRRYDGTYRWQLSRAIPQRDAAGHIQMWVGTSTDIQEQKLFASELERQVQERTGQLEQKNKELQQMNIELESIAYVSSHDLQEPLRKIQTFAARLLEKEQPNLSEVGKDYFRRMSDAANRMQTLIQDLLDYSRTNTAERVFKKTPLQDLVAEAKRDFREAIAEKHAVIEVGKMCAANIIPFQFRQLLHNLIGNALKFSIPGHPPCIKIDSEIVAGSQLAMASLSPDLSYCHLSISDNGIGFDPQYKDRIFEVFQRLHGKSEYKGTGIGLAIVKKIVENHNGVITATSELGHGATFDIYLPVE
ncbi:MAG: PAS domain-containing protein, partial [Saprospiraceae bacterium]